MQEEFGERLRSYFGTWVSVSCGVHVGFAEASLCTFGSCPSDAECG